MYSGLLLLAVIVLPVPSIIIGIKKRERPYAAVLQGILAAGIGMVAVFVISGMAGYNMAKEMTTAVAQMEQVLPPEQMEMFRAIYETAIKAVPGTMLVMAAIISYLEYIIFSHIVKVKGDLADRMPPLKEFMLPRNAINGWFVIFILAWLLKLSGLPAGEVVVLNINVLFSFTFGIQGISLILLWGHLRKKPKAMPILIVILLWIVPLGRIGLLFLGIGDLFFGLRQKITPK